MLMQFHAKRWHLEVNRMVTIAVGGQQGGLDMDGNVGREILMVRFPKTSYIELRAPGDYFAAGRFNTL